MRKYILFGLMAAVAVPGMAPAQSRGEIRRDREEVREQRQDLEDARRRGDRGDIREERRDLREARQELREDRRDRQDRRRSQYVAPYRDWRYSTVNPGYRLRSGFYGSRYHITDVNQYRLRPATRNQRWIRYGNDILLVNVRNGRVLQVIRNRYY
jgi:Ni/Co efflux regulator RcnB